MVVFNIITLILIVILIILCRIIFKKKDNKQPVTIKSVILNIMYFTFFFVVYYFVIAVISMIPLYFISSVSGDGTDNGLWAYGMILSVILSPVLSIITTSRLNHKNNN